MEDLGGEIGLEKGLEKFLEEGGKVMVFTPGSANLQAERFFETALAVMSRTGGRAVFVTRMEIQVPPEMKGRIRVEEFVPFGNILKHASVFIHHGGIGTMAQGFRAGVPQLLMAMAHDQPDNGRRMESLGAGIMLTPGTFTPDRVTGALRELPGETFRAAAAVGSRRVSARDPGETDALVEWMKGWGGKRCPVNSGRLEILQKPFGRVAEPLLFLRIEFFPGSGHHG